MKEIAANALTLFDVVGFISSIASLILAVVAIWLSIVFYKLSTEASKDTSEAAKGIAASVDRLEKVFDKLYADTFSMMRDTVSDMRKHIWRDPAAESSNGDSVVSQEIKQLIEDRISEALKAQGIASREKQANMAREMEKLVESVLKSSREQSKKARSEYVLDTIRSRQPIIVRELAKIIGMETGELVTDYLFPLRASGKITWNGSDKHVVNSGSEIRLVRAAGAGDA